VCIEKAPQQSSFSTKEKERNNHLGNNWNFYLVPGKAMQKYGKVGIAVTSFELDDKNKPNPILTHIFWGSSLKQAFDYAKSHLISDYFFSSTFVGEMEWKDEPLRLAYQGHLIGMQQVKLDNVLDALADDAEELRALQEDIGFTECFHDLVKEQVRQ
jgi:hypothetical protein